MSELEQSSSMDVSEGSSPSPESQSSLNQSSSDNSKLSSESQSKPETPFHEHPRFKELIEQKNQFADRLKDYDTRFKEMQEKLSVYEKQSAPKSKEQQLIERLKGIDPEFGTWAEQQEALRNQLNEFNQWKQQMERTNAQKEAASTLESLHAEYKVPKESREMYMALIQQAASSNPNLTPKDLPTVYKQVHGYVSNFLDSYKRSTLAEYTAGKKSDSKVPAASRGTAPKPQGKVEYSKDPEAARAQIVARTLERVRAQKE